MRNSTDSRHLVHEILVTAIKVLQNLHRDLARITQVASVNIAMAALAQPVSKGFGHPFEF
jgi:hypothetical protein